MNSYSRNHLMWADSARVLQLRLQRLAVSEVSRDVLTWIVLGLTVWLGIGVLTASLFGALVGTSELDPSRPNH